MYYSSNKDINILVRNLVSYGWSFEKRSKHSMLWSPDKLKRIVISVSPSDFRAIANIRKHLRNNHFGTKR